MKRIAPGGLAASLVFVAAGAVSIASATPSSTPRTVKGKTCTILGSPRDDLLRGTPGRDVICGFGGNDVLDGRGAATY